MAQTKVWVEGNQLRIEEGGKTTYGNAAWYQIEQFTSDAVILHYANSRTSGDRKILFTDFYDNEATPNNYADEAAVADYLSDKIG